MNELAKFQEPINLQEAVQLAHNNKVWASNIEDKDLLPRISLLVEDVCNTIGQRNVDAKVIKAGVKSIQLAIQTKYKTLHWFEIRQAVMNWANNPSVEVKHFSGANMVKAIDAYDKTMRFKLIKEVWKKDEEVSSPQFSDDQKKELLDRFYDAWKSGTTFYGYTAAYKLMKELNLVSVDKEYYWATIEQAKETVKASLKTSQMQRAISCFVYRSQLEAIEAITYENFWRKDGLKGASSLEAECQRIMVLDYFREKSME